MTMAAKLSVPLVADPRCSRWLSMGLTAALGVVLALAVVLMLGGWRCEGTIKASMGSVSALVATVAGRHVLLVTVPYRPNRVYYRLGLVNVA
jgi:hypothetical protein